MDEMREALGEFVAESRENLDKFDRDLVAIEADPRDRATLDAIFRAVHTLKGTCGFFGLPGLAAIAHAGEGLLVRVRDGALAWDAEITTALLALGDAVRRDLDAIEATGAEAPGDRAALIDRLAGLQSGPARPVAGAPGPGPPEPPPELLAAPSRAPIRVDVDLLDRLMDLVGELVLTRNQLRRHPAAALDAGLAGTSRRLDQVTSSLQDGVMRARMRPIATLWDPLPRVVRDLALACGKSVRLEQEGRSTELDRSLIEAIKDPLTHLVRNAVDHAIEPPADRVARGKPAEGRLRLRAAHRGGLVRVEVEDDGAGIDPGRVARKALERGLITREQAARLGPDEAINLIFRPGFSTAEAVTQVSGRGVGLDVVRANVEAIGGAVEVRSRPGLGTTFALKIPLTLAIIPTLIVLDGRGDPYAIPQPALVELIRLEGDAVARGIEAIGDATFHRLRDELLPLVDLDEALGGPGRDLRRGPVLDLAVLQADGRRFGLAVGAIRDTEEIVVKPLGRLLRGLAQFAGAAILGDGRIALILDVPGLARSAGVAPAPLEGSPAPPPARPAVAARSYLLLGLSGGRRLAVPLVEVARLEEVPASAVGRASGLGVIPHQGRLLPLAWPGGAPAGGPAGTLRVVVCDGPGHAPVGLVVDAILDIVEAEPRVERLAEAPGLAGSALFGDQVADLVDLPALLLASGAHGLP